MSIEDLNSNPPLTPRESGRLKTVNNEPLQPTSVYLAKLAYRRKSRLQKYTSERTSQINNSHGRERIENRKKSEKLPEYQSNIINLFEHDPRKETGDKVYRLGEYIDGVLSGTIKPVRDNVYEQFYKTLKATPDGKEPVLKPTGYHEYPFFTNDPELALYGQDAAANAIVDYMKSAKDNGRADTVLLVIGPSGSGKSTMEKLIKKGFVNNIGVRPQIEGCSAHCNPLLAGDWLLSSNKEKQEEFHQKLKEVHKYELHGELCPECKNRLKQYKEDSRKRLHALEEIKVKAMHYSADTGDGIVTLISDDTRTSSDKVKAVTKLLKKRVNHGLLVYAEISKHDLTAENDYLRDGRLYDRGNEFNLEDTFKMASMTNKEYDNTFAGDKSLKERFTVIPVTYILSYSEEVKSYEKFLTDRRSNIRYSKKIDPETGMPPDGVKHVPQDTLKHIALAAVGTRLFDSSDKTVWTYKVSVDKKLSLYNGEQIDEYDRSELPKIAKEAYDREKEGMDGLSSTMMKELIRKIVSKSGRCINPFEALKLFEEYTRKDQNYTYNEREKSIKNIERAKKLLSENIINTLRRAQLEGFKQRCNQALNEYLNNLEYYIEPAGRPEDPNTDRPIEVNEKLLLAIEDYDRKSRTANDEHKTGATLIDYRAGIFGIEGKLKRMNPDYEFSYQDMPPGIQKGIEEFVIQQDTDVDLLPGLLSRMNSGYLTEDDRRVKQNIEQNLMLEYNCCKDCIHSYWEFAKKCADSFKPKKPGVR